MMSNLLMKRIEDPNYYRAMKILTAMGLTPSQNYREFGPGEMVFTSATGYEPSELAEGLEEWEKASPMKLMFGRILAKKMLNQETLNKYLQKVNEYKNILNNPKNAYPQNTWAENQRIEKLTQIENMQRKFQNPQTLELLNKLFSEIKRPIDIDKILVEDVRSNITYPVK